MTSVKNFQVERPATADHLGRGRFEFTDDYSVFDWGKMPDEIPQKGQSLCTMGAYNFELLEEAGIPTHYRGVQTDEGMTSLGLALESGTVPRELGIELTQVPDLPFTNGAYDYERYFEAAEENYLSPLEVVFRNAVPVGSSLRTRLSPAEAGLDRDDWPDEPVDLPEPVIEFSTKYEEQDRYLSTEKAEAISGPADLSELESFAREVNDAITQQAERTGFVHQDGKIECLYYQGEIRVADVVGTFDENRFSYDGQQVSKEVIRQYHKRTQSEWVDAVGHAKQQATEEGVNDWKQFCEHSPQPLDEAVITAARDLYCAGTNQYIEREVFDAPSLSDAVTAIEQL